MRVRDACIRAGAVRSDNQIHDIGPERIMATPAPSRSRLSADTRPIGGSSASSQGESSRLNCFDFSRYESQLGVEPGPSEADRMSASDSRRPDASL